MKTCEDCSKKVIEALDADKPVAGLILPYEVPKLKEMVGLEPRYVGIRLTPAPMMHHCAPDTVAMLERPVSKR